MISETVTVIGGGLYGCLTADKIKTSFPSCNVRLLENSDHLLTAFDPIHVGGRSFNNGFHGIELPRAQPLLDFFQNELEIDFFVRDNIRKLIISGEMVSYGASYSEYPEKLKAYFAKLPEEKISPARKFVEYVTDEYSELLFAVASRYSSEPESVLSLVFPWFFPNEFDLESDDEGSKFRGLVRESHLKPGYAWPKSLLFNEIQNKFYDRLNQNGIEIILNANVKFDNQKISFLDTNRMDIRTLVDVNERVFFCASPASILKAVSQDCFRNLTKEPRILLNAIVEVELLKGYTNFTEILCADASFVELGRISQAGDVPGTDLVYFQLEIFEKNDWNKEEALSSINKFFFETMIKFGYRIERVVDLIETRRLFNPDAKTNEKALESVNKWAKFYPNLKLLNIFSPINMSKTWHYSSENIQSLT